MLEESRFPDGTGLREAESGTRSGVRSLYRRASWLIALTDGFCAAAALVGAWLIRYGPTSDPRAPFVLVGVVVIWVGVFATFRLYALQHLSASEEFRRLIGAASVAVLLVSSASYWTKGEFPRAVMIGTWVGALALQLATRQGWRTWLALKKADGSLAYRTLVVGTNSEAVSLERDLGAPGSGYNVVGAVDTFESGGPSDALGTLEELDLLVDKTQAECLFVAATAVDDSDFSAITALARRNHLEIRVSANLPEMLTSRLTVQAVGTRMYIGVRPVSLSGPQIFMKRVFDISLSVVGLILSAPLWLVIAVAIKLDSRGPVLYSQRRVSRAGSRFNMLKFRTMRVDSEDRGDEDRSVLFFKHSDDGQLTRVGRGLRRWSLDEVPQLINVLRGDMSIVGPRPLPAEQVDANADLLEVRHEVPSGMTGWWQIQGRSHVAADEALKLDLFYIENWSVSLDLYILLRTVRTVLSRSGAV